MWDRPNIILIVHVFTVMKELGTQRFSTIHSCLFINSRVVLNVRATTDVCVNRGTRGSTTPAGRINSAVNLCFAPDLVVIKQIFFKKEGVFLPVKLTFRTFVQKEKKKSRAYKNIGFFSERVLLIFREERRCVSFILPQRLELHPWGCSTPPWCRWQGRFQVDLPPSCTYIFFFFA